MMDDPADKKPEDWDQAEEIVDAEAKQPEDWDADEDGEWEPPMKKNPDYKGEWKVRLLTFNFVLISKLTISDVKNFFNFFFSRR